MCFSSSFSGADSCERGVGSEGESDGRHEQREHHTHRGQPDSEEVRRTMCARGVGGESGYIPIGMNEYSYASKKPSRLGL